MATTPTALGQVPTELHRVSMDVDGGEVGALWADNVEALGDEAVTEAVALVLKAGPDRIVARWPLGQGARDGRLDRGPKALHASDETVVPGHLDDRRRHVRLRRCRY